VTPTREPDVRAELDRILASKGFATAGRLSKLLRYVVEKTLAGETDQLKEYAVGIEVFERDDKYDPRLDSIVRVEAGRLRTKLDEYYNGEGSASPIRISLPRGGYSAVFERAAAPAAPPLVEVAAAPQPRRSRLTIPLTAGLLCAIAAMVVWLGGWNRQPQVDQRPSVAVLAFHANMAGEENERLAERITEAVTTELARLGTVAVASHTSAMQFAGQHGSIKEISAALNAIYIVEASVDDETTQMLVVARIVNGETDRKMWVADYRGAKDDVRGMAQRIAFDINQAVLERERTKP